MNVYLIFVFKQLQETGQMWEEQLPQLQRSKDMIHQKYMEPLLLGDQRKIGTTFLLRFSLIFWPKASELLSWRCVRLASVCPSVHPSVHSSWRASVNSFFKKTSQKLLTGSVPNFTGMLLRWPSFKFIQIIVFHEEFWLP